MTGEWWITGGSGPDFTPYGKKDAEKAARFIIERAKKPSTT